MKNFVQPGDVISVTAPASASAGAGVLVGSIFGVAVNTALSGAAVEIATRGVFDLTKGSLLLSGETPPNPFLDMLGETRVLDTLVQVHLNGPARNFRLSLTSVPALPQDELLAMILFGRSMREISSMSTPMPAVATRTTYSTVTDFARLRGLSTSQPRVLAT